MNSTADAVVAGNGQCTLREAINNANAGAVDTTGGDCATGTVGLDAIAFNLGAGTPTISVTGPNLPFITEPVDIDGGTGGATRVELDGTAAGVGSTGLTIQAGGSTVRSLVINRFGGNGIALMTGGGNAVENCYIGTDAAGTADLGNALDGVLIQTSNGNTIGGTVANTGNVISGNNSRGIEISAAATGNTVRGNYIGTNAAGTSDLGNALDGVLIFGANNTVGGISAADRNIISGNDSNGVRLDGGVATGNTVEGNYIGTDVNGTADLGNTLDGVLIFAASSNTVGGTISGARNVISGNNNWGVRIVGAASNNSIQGNYIGTNASGTAARGNSFDGVAIYSSNNTAGGRPQEPAT